jgi:hypothetical protein
VPAMGEAARVGTNVVLLRRADAASSE